MRLGSKARSRRNHPSSASAFGRAAPVAAPRSPAPPRKSHQVPLVDAFLAALEEVQQSRETFGSWGPLLAGERTVLDDARAGVIRAWTRGA